MVQVTTNQLQPLLCCPCTLRSHLELTEQGKLKCRNNQCPNNNQCFLQIADQPVLINFDESVFKEEDYLRLEDGSVLNRKPSNIHQFISSILWGKNEKSQINLQKFLRYLHLQDQNYNPTILVVGGASVGRGSEDLYTNPKIKVISFDVYSSIHTDFVADAHSIPIQDESIDGVWIQAVLEHVLEPEKVVSEIYRVLKPNGIVYADTPFMQQVHEKAYDFTRFTESGHRWLFRNFNLIDSGVVAGAGTTLSWSLRYFFVGLLRNKTLGAGLAALFFWLRYFDRFIPDTYSSDAASAVYFMGIKSEKPIKPSEIIEFYKGVVK